MMDDARYEPAPIQIKIMMASEVKWLKITLYRFLLVGFEKLTANQSDRLKNANKELKTKVSVNATSIG